MQSRYFVRALWGQILLKFRDCDTWWVSWLTRVSVVKYLKLTYWFINLHTVLCKSNANDNQQISHFVLVIYCRYISETSTWTAERYNNKSARYRYNLSDIVLARLRCNDIAPSKMIYCHDMCHDISLQQTSLQWFMVMKWLCALNPCLCACNGHSRAIGGWTKTKISLSKSSPCFAITSSFHMKAEVLRVNFMWKMFSSPLGSIVEGLD